jgi:anti-sigma factor RsiW
MSILDRLSPNRHLDDAALTELWTASALGGADARGAHVDGCPSCRSRYAALDAWLGDLAGVARAEADEAFPAERLAMQQTQVMRRLEALERPARVIVFPRHVHPITGERSGARRWIAAAAAAGLVVGIAAGQLLDLRDALGGPTRPFAERRQIETAPPVATIQPASLSSAQSDEAFLSELEDAALSPRVPELAALDAVTPRLPDISAERSQ